MAITCASAPPASATHGCKAFRRRQTLQDPINCRALEFSTCRNDKDAPSIPTTSSTRKPVQRVQRQGVASKESNDIDEGVRPKARPTLKSSSNRPRSSSEGSPTASTSRSTPNHIAFHPLNASYSYPLFERHKTPAYPLIHDFFPAPPPYSQHPEPAAELGPNGRDSMHTDTEEDHDEDDILYTSSRLANGARLASSSSQSLRSRIFALASSSSPRPRHKTISTTPGALCAGETETETDEPSRHLPTARIVPPSGPIVPPSTFAERVTPLLFEFSRLLSIVPAVFGTLYNMYHILYPPTLLNSRPQPGRLDYFLSALWAILTGFQCLRLATGLLTRWRLYYDPLSTLVRLLALQGICWPATHLTLSILEHEKRPVICWAVIGTTTCMSRSVQIWVTSNLWWDERRDSSSVKDDAPNESPSLLPLGNIAASPAAAGHVVSAETAQERRRAYWKRWSGGGKWGGRRWDWKEVGAKCILPAGILYFVVAWAELLRREFAPPAC